MNMTEDITNNIGLGHPIKSITLVPLLR